MSNPDLGPTHVSVVFGPLAAEAVNCCDFSGLFGQLRHLSNASVLRYNVFNGHHDAHTR